MKSRELHLPDLFRILQLEWITYRVRLSIYQREEDLKKFRDILKMKEDRINKFALRNSTPSIFSSKEKMDKYLLLFYPTEGERANIPDFQYTPTNENTYCIFDKLFFYKKDSFVLYKNELCKIEYNDCNKKELVLKLKDDSSKKVGYCDTRKEISYFLNL